MGYREGLFEGKSQAMQPGFDAGFSLYSRLRVLLDFAQVLLNRVKESNVVLAARLGMSMKQIREDTTVYTTDEVKRLAPVFNDLIHHISLYVESDYTIEYGPFPTGLNGERIFPVLNDFYTCLCEALQCLIK